MTISRKLGVLLLMGVPAIVGGGIVFHFFQNYTAMIMYEILLGLTALGLVSR